MSNHSRLLVIDASVLRSAGDKTGHSKHCTELLYKILTICHRAVLCEELKLEWNRHQSRVSIKWRSAMISKKQLILKNVTVQAAHIQSQIDSAVSLTNAAREAIEKDIHLIALSKMADNILLTGDLALKNYVESNLNLSPIEWLTNHNAHTLEQNQEVIGRLVELNKKYPSPPIPSSYPT